MTNKNNKNAFKPQTLELQATKEYIDNNTLTAHTGEGTKAFMGLTNRNLIQTTQHRNLNEAYQISMFSKEPESPEIFIKNYDRLKASLGVNTRKLFLYLISCFTEINDGANKNSEPKLEVYVSLKKYAEIIGKNITGEDKNDKEILKELQKTIKKDLNILSLSNMKFNDTIKGKSDYFNMSIIGSNSVSVKTDTIYVAFDVAFSRYLKLLPITKLPISLFKIDGRNGNLLDLAYYMAEYYNMPRNQQRGTNDRLRVETLVNYANLPKYKEIKSTKSWRYEIKEKLEGYLEELYKAGYITEWEYRLKNNNPITDTKYDPETYNEWKELRVFYNIIDSEYYQTKIANNLKNSSNTNN